ncbi:doublecortin domain-containing protein 2-like isoform X1 [Pecten maximus]|uniref:doublecortin domain-containing protein 2-like isoform X1 n=1 Tax=Pecten maximus TaxID=6579 RepID=UPI001458A951|nr:doublecortin domain-containing protein 2-like isoform X1 [Pecten maximus]
MSSPRSGRSNTNHLHSVPTAKSVYMCKNGDLFTPPKRIIINTSSMNTLLDEVTKKIKANECMRDVYTPKGKTHIKNVSELENGQYYVVKPGRGRFKEYNYQSISPYKTPRKGQRQSRNNSSIFSRWFKEDNFAHHLKNSRYDDIKPRFHETGDPGIRIHVHKNNQPQDKSVLVLLKPRRLEHMKYIIEDITKELREDSKYPVKYVYNLNGDMITKPSDFQPEEFYVAVPPQQVFKHCPYSCRRYDLPNFITNPYYGTGLPPSAYLWQDPFSSSRPTTWTSKYNPVPPISKPSPNQSVASHPETNLRRRKIQNAHEDVHQKAVKHKRTPERRVRQVDYDQDDSDVFRAKNQNKSTRGAKEVKETRDTKTDLPIDQVKAEEVEEELLPPAHHHLAPLEINRGPSDEDHEYTKEDIHGYDQDERRSPRGQPYTKEKSNRDMNRYKVLDPIKTEQRSSTPVDDDDDDDDDKRRKEEEEAATKIQASFRGHQTRQELSQKKKEDTNQTKQDTNQNKQDTNQNKRDTNQREDTHDSFTSKEENEAAAKIQAGFRGYQTRQELKAKGHKVRPALASQGDTGDTSKVTKEQEDEAATKIQASFRGYQARKDIKKLQDEKKKNEAATLIQANFKGYKVRKEMKEKKGGEDEPKPKTSSNQKQEKETMSEDEAATKIQASFRGYQSRQKLKEQGKGIGQGNGDSKTVISTPPHSSEAPGTKRLA